MKYKMIRKCAIYTFIAVTISMTLLGVIAIWFPGLEGIIGRAFATVLVVGLGCIAIVYAASLLAKTPEKREALPSFAPHPKPVPPPPNHLARGE